MWTSIIFALLVGLATSSSPSYQGQWQQNEEYIYDVTERTMTALPDVEERFVGLLTKAKLVLQVKNENEILGRIEKAGHAHFHQIVENMGMSEIPEENLQFEETELKGLTFVIRQENGAIKNLLVESQTTNAQANRIKALLSPLQVDLKGENLMRSSRNQMPTDFKRPTGYFRVMEPTITGECSTTYDISVMPQVMVEKSQTEWAPQTYVRSSKDAFQIMKTVNYSRCDIPVGYHHGLTGASNLKPNSNQIGDFLSKSSISRIIATGNAESFTIQESTTDNRVAVSPQMYQESKALVLSQIQLSLLKKGQFTHELKEPHNAKSVGSLVYRNNIPSDKDSKNQDRSDELNSDEVEKERKRYARSDDYRNDNRNEKYDWSDESNYSQNKNWRFQPKPNMKNAPESPQLPLTVGYKGKNIKFASQINIETEAVKLTKEIAATLKDKHDDIPKLDTLGKFVILVDLITIMDHDEMKNVAQHLKVDQRDMNNVEELLARKIFKDACAQSGTNPAVAMVIHWIEKQVVEGERAAALISTVCDAISTPTEEVVREIFERIIKNENLRKQKHFYSTALMSFSDLVRRAYSDEDSAKNYYPVQAFGSFAKRLEKLIRSDVIPHFMKRLDESANEGNQKKVLLYLRVLGNIAHPQILVAFKKHFEKDGKFSKLQRTAAVLALDKLTDIHPEHCQDILFNIYSNVNEVPETRSVAALLLMRTNPPAAMLQRMAHFTNVDPSEAVQAIVKSAILSMAELDSADLADLASNAKAARDFLNPRDFGVQYSKTELRDFVANELNMVYKSQLSHIIGEEHFLPKGAWFESFKNYGGFAAKDAEVQVMLSSVEQVLNLWPNPQQEESDRKNHNHNGNKNKRHSKISVATIAKKLGINEDEAEELEGQILINLMGGKRFYTFDDETMKNLPETIAAGLAAIRESRKVVFNRIFDRRQVTISFPLATGYPFTFTIRNPTLLQALGEIKAKTSPDAARNPSWKEMMNIESVNASARVHLVYSTQQISKIGFITPFDNHRYVAGYIKKSQVHLPIEADLDIDILNNKISGRIQPIDNKMDFKLFHSSAWPFTLRKSVFELRPAAEAKNVKLANSKPSQFIERTIGEKSTGMVFRIMSENKLSANNLRRVNKMLVKEGIDSLARLPYSYQTVMQNLMGNRLLTPYDFIPFTFEPSKFGSNVPQALLSLAVAPFYQDLTPEEILRTQGALSLLINPMGDGAVYDKVAETRRVLATNGLPWPTSTLDHYHINVKYDAGKSANHQIKFAFSMNKQHDWESNTHSSSQRMKASVDEKKLALVRDSSPDSEERVEQMLVNAAYGIKQATAGVIDMSVVFDGHKRAEYVATIAQSGSLVDDKERVLVFLSAKPSKSSGPKQIAITYTGKYPSTPELNFEQALNDDTKSSAKLDIVWAENGKQMSSQAVLRVEMKQTEEYKEYVAQSQSARKCMRQMKNGNDALLACLDATYHANINDLMAFKFEFNDLPAEARNMTNQLAILLKNIGIYSLSENINKHGKQNEIEGVLRMAPHAKYVNLTIQGEKLRQEYTNLPVDPMFRKLFVIHPGKSQSDLMQISEFKYGDICTINQDKILTFDNSEIEKQNIGKSSWYAAMQTQFAKYGSFKHQKQDEQPLDASILIRRSAEGNDKKEVEIIVAQRSAEDHVIRLMPQQSGSNYRVKINGQDKVLSAEKMLIIEDKEMNRENVPAIRIAETKARELIVEIRDQMRIVYNGENLQIQADPMYRNNTVGLCGTYTGEQLDDFVTPQGCVLKESKYFAAAWQIIDESSSAEAKQLFEKSQQADCDEIRYSNQVHVIKAKKSGDIDWSRRTDSSAENSNEESTMFSSYEDKRSSNYRDEEKNNNKDCHLKKQVQYTEHKGQTCVTLERVPVCPRDCVQQETESEQFSTRCFANDSSKANSLRQQIRKGANPRVADSDGKPEMHTFNVPKFCKSRN